MQIEFGLLYTVAAAPSRSLTNDSIIKIYSFSNFDSILKFICMQPFSLRHLVPVVNWFTVNSYNFFCDVTVAQMGLCQSAPKHQGKRGRRER